MISSKSSLLIAAAALTVGVLACSAPAATALPPAPTQPTLAAPATDPAAPTLDPAAPTDVPTPVEGFSSGTAVDVATLPVLIVPAVGVGGAFCDGTYSEPAMNVIPVLNGQQQLCLYHFPTAEGSPDITVTLTDPDGESYTETFSYSTGEFGLELLDSNGEFGGSIYDPATTGLEPSVGIWLNTPANVPSGQWTASASTADGSIDISGPINIVRQGQQLSVVSDTVGNPFINLLTAFSTGDTLYVYGAGYGANTTLTLAFYRVDESLGQSEFGTPKLAPTYAVTLTTDGTGRFQTTFGVGPTTVTGSYYTIAEPAITADLFVNPFEATFVID